MKLLDIFHSLKSIFLLNLPSFIASGNQIDEFVFMMAAVNALQNGDAVFLVEFHVFSFGERSNSFTAGFDEIRFFLIWTLHFPVASCFNFFFSDWKTFEIVDKPIDEFFIFSALHSRKLMTNRCD